MFDPGKQLEWRVRYKGLTEADKRTLMSDNLINDRISLETPVYRICPLSQLIMLLKNNVLLFKAPRKWPDPFETLLLRCLWPRGDEWMSFKKVSDNIFGHCWSTVKECDGLWRGHVGLPGKMIFVQLESSVGRILSAMYETLEIQDDIEDYKHPRFYVGAVEYRNKEEIGRISRECANHLRSKVKNGGCENSDYYEVIKSVFLKREAFCYEHEIRFVVDTLGCDTDKAFKGLCGNRIGEGELRVLADPKSLIRKIKVDPWTKDSSVELVKMVVDKYAPEIEVEPSILYEDANMPEV